MPSYKNHSSITRSIRRYNEPFGSSSIETRSIQRSEFVHDPDIATLRLRVDVKLKYSNISALLYAALNTSWYWYILTSLYFDKFSQKSQISWDKVTWLWQLTYYFQSKSQNFSNFRKLQIYNSTLLFKMWLFWYFRWKMSNSSDFKNNHIVCFVIFGQKFDF